MDAALAVGSLEVVERARVRFPSNTCLQKNAALALQGLYHKRDTNTNRCAIQ